MTLSELRYLVAVADHGHFGRASQACHVSQPTLSAQLKKLEEYLGAPLVERTSRRVKLTAMGEEVVRRARRVIAEADGIVQLTRHRKGPLVGPLPFGMIPTLGPYLLPWLMPALRSAYPELTLVLHEGLTGDLLELIEAHRIDAALLALPVDAPWAVTVPLFDEPFLLACPADHPLARQKEVPQADLAGHTMLLLGDGHCLRDQALAVCGLSGPPVPGADVSATGLETIRQMVVAGMGCTLLPALATRDPAPHPKGMMLRPIAGDAHRRIGLIYRRGYPRADELRLLAETIRTAVPCDSGLQLVDG